MSGIKITEERREQLFLEKVQIRDGCWIWTGGRGGYEKSYGTFFDGTRTVRAHRWAYCRWVGEIPVGLELDHRCRVRLCVNPKHLEPVTRLENMRRSPPRFSNFCDRAHPMFGPNLRRSPNGKRICRACERIRYRRWVERQKGGTQQTNS
jgi:hypothetical protein